MAAGQYNFTIEQGTTFTQPFVWKETASGPVINLTGYTARMQIRPTLADTNILLDLTTANGKLAIDGPNGKVTIQLTATETAALDFVTAVYDLELVSGSGAVTRLLKGTISLDKEITR